LAEFSDLRRIYPQILLKSLVEKHRLMGMGIGWIDAHLLCSAKLTGVRLWTLDKRLNLAARSVDLGARL